MCLTYQFIIVITKSAELSERIETRTELSISNFSLGNRHVRLPQNRKLLQESGELCSLYNSNPAKLAAV